MSQLAKVFHLNRQGFNLERGFSGLAIMLLPLIVLSVLHQEKYFLSMVFAVLFVGLSDPGGEYGYRVPRMALVAVAGGLLTALGFGIGGEAWGLVVLAVFVITLLSGLAVKYGLHRFVAALLLNIWFLIALSLPGAYHLDHVHTSAWAQALAWLIGSALALAYVTIMWLARGRTAQAQPGADVLPGSTAPVPLTRQVILFAVIRAIALAIAVAIAFGLHVPNADWMPVAALVAMKPSLAQSALFAEQRLAGTIIGAIVAALFLLTLHSKTGLEVVIVILGALAGSIRAVNYALYCAAVAGAVLIGMDLPHPSNLADEGRRILFTFIGVGIAVVVMFLATQLQKRTPKTAAPAPQAGST
jgi:Fusaric acid resistance protein-like